MTQAKAVVNAETDLSGKQQRASKIKGIVWSKLGVDKDPEFHNTYFLFGNSGNNQNPIDDFQVGTLAEIKTYPECKKYTWIVGGQDDERTHFSHFAICVKPVE